MVQLRLISLGGVRVLIDGQDVTPELPLKIVALMIYLARQEKPKSREHLAELLWPNRSAKNAYGSLRTAISKSRHIVGDALHVSHHEVGLAAELDANRFEVLLHQPETLGEALSLYQGEFMASFYADDAREFDDWQLRETEKLHEKFILATAQHIQALQAQGNLPSAIMAARHALTLAPLQEDLHRTLIQLYHASGERVSAVKQYQTCRNLLWEEFGLEPDAETQALYARIEQLTPTPILSTVEARLPVRITSFIGRGDALFQAENWLAQSALVTITATGGSGKTRVAVELAYRFYNRFRDGVYFIDLSVTTHADQVPQVVAQTLGLSQEMDALTQVAERLRNRHTLLILDNFEQVIDAAPSLAYWMTQAKDLKLIVTSREPLKLYGEYILHLQPLSLQESCQLFYERVRMIHTDFQRTEAIDIQIKIICQYLDGLPLAIELAATRARTLSFEEIMSELSQRLQWLSSDLRDLPRRQRTLFNTIEWSYQLLSDNQAALFRQLAVFRGGWTQEAVNHICSQANALTDLVDKNLIRRAFFGTHRFTMLETIREYAYYQLEKSDELYRAQDAHVRWVLSFIENAAQRLRTTQHLKALHQLGEEEENIHAALEYLSTQHHQLETYARIISAQGWVWNLSHVAQIRFTHAQHALQYAEHLPEDIRANLLLAGGNYADAIGDHTLAESWHRESLKLFESLGDELNATYVRFAMGGRVTNEKTAQEIFARLRVDALRQQDNYLLSMVNNNLGLSLVRAGDFQRGLMVLEEGLEISEENGYHLLIPFYCLNLGGAYLANDDIQMAFSVLERAHEVSEANGDVYVQVFSFFDLCELCYSVNRLDELQGYVTRAETLTLQLHSPTLLVRLYFWRALLAYNRMDTTHFYKAYRQILYHLNPDNVNTSQYILNALVYLAWVLAQRGNMAEAALLIGGADMVSDQLQMPYVPFQNRWRQEALDRIGGGWEDELSHGARMPLSALLQAAEGALEQVVMMI